MPITNCWYRRELDSRAIPDDSSRARINRLEAYDPAKAVSVAEQAALSFAILKLRESSVISRQRTPHSLFKWRSLMNPLELNCLVRYARIAVSA